MKPGAPSQTAKQSSLLALTFSSSAQQHHAPGRFPNRMSYQDSLLHIADATGEEIKKAASKTVGLLEPDSPWSRISIEAV